MRNNKPKKLKKKRNYKPNNRKNKNNRQNNNPITILNGAGGVAEGGRMRTIIGEEIIISHNNGEAEEGIEILNKTHSKKGTSLTIITQKSRILKEKLMRKRKTTQSNKILQRHLQLTSHYLK